MAMDKQTDREQKKLQGNELTHEQFSDVYMSGTSDGVQQLGKETKKIERETYEE